MQRKKGSMPPRKHSYEMVKEYFRQYEIVTFGAIKEMFEAENHCQIQRDYVSNILLHLENSGFLIAEVAKARYSLFREVKDDQ